MKQILETILLGLVTLLMCACNDQEEVIDNVSSNIQTRTGQQTEDSWCNHEYCVLGNQKRVLAPWASHTISAVPNHFLKDVKPEDGWEILYSNVQIDGYKGKYNYMQMNEGANYMLYYNRYNGMLKGFCYLETVSPNNQGLWHLVVNESTSLFNFVGLYANPLDGPKKHDVYLSTITEDGLSGGFNKGWNCFQVELAYDPNSMNQTLNISGVNLNKTEYNLSSLFMMTSTGSIRMALVGSGSGIFNSLVTGTGKAIEDLIKQQKGFNPATIKAALYSIAAKGAYSLINSGLNKLFPSLSGSSYQMGDLNVTTVGKDTIYGKSIMPSSGNVIPISGIKLNGLHHDLGVWNIVSSPKYQILNPSLLVSLSESWGTALYKYTIDVIPEYKIIVNPVYRSTHHEWGLEMAITQEGISDIFTNIREISEQQIGGFMTYPSSYEATVANALPNKAIYAWKNGRYPPTPALDWDMVSPDPLHSPKPWEDVSFYIYHTLYTNNNRYISRKVFRPIRKFKERGDAVPYWWTNDKIRQEGF